ncbi:MAG: toll/interleukin-1 receptor domain-containing protein, partial [Anaerolineae bacterium]
RDFPPGAGRADAIAWAIANSRHTIAVLTPEYVADEWQMLEALAARSADPAAWRRKLLPLRLKPCATPAAIAAIALEVADLTDPYAARYALARLLKALE